MSQKAREGFHKAVPDASIFFCQITGTYTHQYYADMYEVWEKALEFAKPEADLREVKTHSGERWTNLAQHSMLRMGDPTLEAAVARALAEGFRLPEQLQLIATEVPHGVD